VNDLPSHNNKGILNVVNVGDVVDVGDINVLSYLIHAKG